MSDSLKKEATITITDEKIAFLSINIGSMFFAHDCLWVRTSYDGASSLGERTNVNGSYGSCTFTKDEEDRLVNVVLLSFK